MPHRVAFLGFSEFERKALTSYFRLTHNRSPAYEQVPTLTDADFLVADADHGPSVQLVQAIERMDETVFIGNLAPEGARAWMTRPIDALHVMRELDRLVAHALGARAPRDDYAGPHTTIIQLARQRRGAPVAPPDPDDNALLGDLPFSAPEPAAVRAPKSAHEPASQAAAEPAFESASATAALDPLTLRDPRPSTVRLAPDCPPPENGLVAHEPALPATRPPVPEAEWLSKPPPAAPASPVLPVAGVARATAMTGATAATATKAPPEGSRVQAPMPPKAPVQRVALMPAKPRVLLVDDSAIALRFLEVRLGGWQLEVDRAATSQAAVALLAQHSYDIVFLDIELGAGSELDGLTLCQRIKHSPALLGAMVILVSAHHSELDRVRGALAGCDAYLAKPLDMQELQRLMDRQGVLAVSSEGAAAP
jgi:CheY-like chemotaxis protein